jgi:hypothetical protein
MILILSKKLTKLLGYTLNKLNNLFLIINKFKINNKINYQNSNFSLKTLYHQIFKIARVL